MANDLKEQRKRLEAQMADLQKRFDQLDALDNEDDGWVELKPLKQAIEKRVQEAKTSTERIKQQKGKVDGLLKQLSDSTFERSKIRSEIYRKIEEERKQEYVRLTAEQKRIVDTNFSTARQRERQREEFRQVNKGLAPASVPYNRAASRQDYDKTVADSFKAFKDKYTDTPKVIPKQLSALDRFFEFLGAAGGYNALHTAYNFSENRKRIDTTKLAPDLRYFLSGLPSFAKQYNTDIANSFKGVATGQKYGKRRHGSDDYGVVGGTLIDILTDPTSFGKGIPQVAKLLYKAGGAGLKSAAKLPGISKGADWLGGQFDIFHDLRKVLPENEVKIIEQSFSTSLSRDLRGYLFHLQKKLDKKGVNYGNFFNQFTPVSDVFHTPTMMEKISGGLQSGVGFLNRGYMMGSLVLNPRWWMGNAMDGMGKLALEGADPRLMKVTRDILGGKKGTFQTDRYGEVSYDKLYAMMKKQRVLGNTGPVEIGKIVKNKKTGLPERDYSDVERILMLGTTELENFMRTQGFLHNLSQKGARKTYSQSAYDVRKMMYEYNPIYRAKGTQALDNFFPFFNFHRQNLFNGYWPQTFAQKTGKFNAIGQFQYATQPDTYKRTDATKPGFLQNQLGFWEASNFRLSGEDLFKVMANSMQEMNKRVSPVMGILTSALTGHNPRTGAAVASETSGRRYRNAGDIQKWIVGYDEVSGKTDPWRKFFYESTQSALGRNMMDFPHPRSYFPVGVYPQDPVSVDRYHQMENRKVTSGPGVFGPLPGISAIGDLLAPATAHAAEYASTLPPEGMVNVRGRWVPKYAIEKWKEDNKAKGLTDYSSRRINEEGSEQNKQRAERVQDELWTETWRATIAATKDPGQRAALERDFKIAQAQIKIEQVALDPAGQKALMNALAAEAQAVAPTRIGAPGKYGEGDLIWKETYRDPNMAYNKALKDKSDLMSWKKEIGVSGTEGMARILKEYYGDLGSLEQRIAVSNYRPSKELIDELKKAIEDKRVRAELEELRKAAEVAAQTDKLVADTLPPGLERIRVETKAALNAFRASKDYTTLVDKGEKGFTEINRREDAIKGIGLEKARARTAEVAASEASQIDAIVRDRIRTVSANFKTLFEAGDLSINQYYTQEKEAIRTQFAQAIAKAQEAMKKAGDPEGTGDIFVRGDEKQWNEAKKRRDQLLADRDTMLLTTEGKQRSAVEKNKAAALASAAWIEEVKKQTAQGARTPTARDEEVAASLAAFDAKTAEEGNKRWEEIQGRGAEPWLLKPEEVEAIEKQKDDVYEFYRQRNLQREQLQRDEAEKTRQLMLNGSASMLGDVANMFKTFYEATGKKHKEFFVLMKAFSIAETMISGISASMEAYKNAQKAFGAYGMYVAPVWAGIVMATTLAKASLIASQGYAEGGLIEGPRTAAVDKKSVRVTPGEYVERRAAVDYYGVDVMEAINRRQIDRRIFSVPSMPITRGSSHFAQGGLVDDSASGMEGGMSLSVYNIVDTHLLDKYMASNAGKRTMLNFISGNRAIIKTVLS